MTDETIFTAALEKADPAEQAAFLDEVCAGDMEQRRRLDALLMVHASAADFLQRPALAQRDPETAHPRAVDHEGGGPAEAEVPLTFLEPPPRPESLGRIGH